MPEFAYIARTAAGRDVTGTLVAGSKREILAALGEKSLYPIRVEAIATRASVFRRKKRITASVLSSNLSQLADLLQNGVPLLASLKLLAEQCGHPTLTEVLTDVHDRVAEGTSFDEALAAHPRVFGELTVSMVRAGSEGGFLEDALKRTATFLELQEELKARVVSAMAYPTILATVGFIVTTALIVFFVPKFAELFERLERQGSGLPAATVALLALSDVLGRYGLVLAAAFVGLGVWLRKAAATSRGRMTVDRVKLKIPVAGSIFLNSAVSRLCRVLGTLLRNGVPLLKAMEISRDSAGNRILAEAIRRSAENISSGDTLARPLAECGLIPKPVMAMISIAEQSNNLDDVLINVADGLDRKIARQLDIMVRLVEPAMLLVMGGVIMFVLSALLLPVFEMSATMN